MADVHEELYLRLMQLLSMGSFHRLHLLPHLLAQSQTAVVQEIDYAGQHRKEIKGVGPRRGIPWRVNAYPDSLLCRPLPVLLCIDCELIVACWQMGQGNLVCPCRQLYPCRAVYSVVVCDVLTRLVCHGRELECDIVVLTVEVEFVRHYRCHICYDVPPRLLARCNRAPVHLEIGKQDICPPCLPVECCRGEICYAAHSAKDKRPVGRQCGRTIGELIALKAVLDIVTVSDLSGGGVYTVQTMYRAYPNRASLVGLDGSYAF